MTDAELPDHDCDQYAHCILGDNAENRLLAAIFNQVGGEDYSPPRRGHHCPLCADWKEGDTLVRFKMEKDDE